MQSSAMAYMGRAALLACLCIGVASAQYMPNRPPGTLLLNMLIKDERDHLERTLPRWANIIDYWIIGVDDHNTDDSPEVIQKYLGHIPGEIVIVEFDGMGPTWSQLVEVGIEKYPQATHGILADADFMPMKNSLDKMQLDIRCSKHMYTIWTEDHRNERKMDWIYRNIPGAVVRRRTHQILEVPELPDQEVFQTLIDLPVEERTGGYQDRTGKKNERYIGFLEADLVDYPGDTRTLYYLGYAHFDIYNQNLGNLKPEHHEHLRKGVTYFQQRSALHEEGNKEELWFALLKLGEIFERFYKDWDTAEKYYRECVERDPERADAYFYLGQHYRLMGDPETSLKDLYIAATLPVPTRSLFQWHYLYQCLSKLEYARAVSQLPKVSKKRNKQVRKVLKSARCEGGDPANVAEVRGLQSSFQARTALSVPSGEDRNAYVLRKQLNFFADKIDLLEESLSGAEAEGKVEQNMFAALAEHIVQMDDFVSRSGELKTDEEALKRYSTCRRYRQVTTPYLRFMKANGGRAKTLLPRKMWKRWSKLQDQIRGVCR